MRFRFFFSSALMLILFVSAARSQAPITWQTLTSESGEFSMAVPSGYTVYREERWDRTSIVGGGGEASFSVSFRKTSNAGESFERLHDYPSTKGKEADYVVGESRVHFYTYQGTKIYRTSITVATKKGYYSVAISAPTFENPVLLAMLASIQVGNKPLTKGAMTPPPDSASIINASHLETSEIVKAALKHKQKGKVLVETQLDNTATLEDKEIIYSRRLMILRKSPASYNDRARSRGAQGVVRLKILFKGDGDIGRIIVLKGLPDGLTDQAIAAAMGIKFLPAQIDGLPADTERRLEYSFAIY